VTRMFPEAQDLINRAQQLASAAPPALPSLPSLPSPPTAVAPQQPPIAPPPGPGSTGPSVDRLLLHTQSRFVLSVPALGVELGLFTQVQGLSAQVDVIEYPEGGLNTYVHKLPTRIKHPNLTCKQGVTHEDGFLLWLNETVVKAKLTDIALHVYEPDGTVVRSWGFAGAYPVKWTGPDLNAGGTEIMTESLEIAHQGIMIASSK
jgi:phage tail-like protein